MASVTRFDPRGDYFGELVDDLFKGFLVRPLGFEGRADASLAQLPRAKVDVAEKNGAYLVTAELPGVKKEDIHVAIDGPQVTLEAEVKREKEARLRQGRAQLHAAAGSRRVQGGSQIQGRRARADAAQEGGRAAQADHDPVSLIRL